jgi:O-antigen/teichoic acid export membrane protein
MSRSTPRTSRILLYSATAAIGYRAINVAGGLITLPLLLSGLGQTQFGIWIVIGQAVSLLALSDLGVGNTVGRFVARFRGQNDVEALDRLLSTSMLLLLAFGVLIALLTLVFANSIVSLLPIHPQHHEMTRHAFVIVGLAIACQMPLRIGLGVMIGYQLYGPHAIGKILESVLTFGGILILALLERIELVPLAVLTASCAIASQVVLVAMAWRLTGPWMIRPRNVSRTMAREIIGMAGSVVTLTMANMVHIQGLGLAVARLLGVSAAGVYGVCLTILNNIHPLVTSVAIPLSTLSSEWQARNDKERLRRVSTIVMRFTFGISACMAVGLFVFGEPALRIWLRNSDWNAHQLHEAARTLAIMGVGLAVGLPQMGSRSTLQGVGHHWFVSGSVLFASTASLAIGCWAMAAGWGVAGAALGWSLVWAFQGLLLFPPMISHYLDQPMGQMLRQGYLPGALVAGITLVTAWVLSAWILPPTLEWQLCAATASAIVGSIGLIFISNHTAVWDRLRRILAHG